MSLADLLAQEERNIAKGQAQPCGYSCTDHGGNTCLRAVHPDEEDNRSPHLARRADGSLVQWVGPCVDP